MSRTKFNIGDTIFYLVGDEVLSTSNWIHDINHNDVVLAIASLKIDKIVINKNSVVSYIGGLSDLAVSEEEAYSLTEILEIFKEHFENKTYGN